MNKFLKLFKRLLFTKDPRHDRKGRECLCNKGVGFMVQVLST